MTDQPEAPTGAPISPHAALTDELSSSLSSVWARYAGSRPTDARVVVDSDVVRWTLPGGKAELETGMTAANEARDPGQPARTVRSYERETSAAVSRTTRCAVRARISKLDKATGAATETFILEAPTRKY